MLPELKSTNSKIQCHAFEDFTQDRNHTVRCRHIKHIKHFHFLQSIWARKTRICTLFQLTLPGPLTLPPTTTSTVAITVAYVSWNFVKLKNLSTVNCLACPGSLPHPKTAEVPRAAHRVLRPRLRRYRPLPGRPPTWSHEQLGFGVRAEENTSIHITWQETSSKHIKFVTWLKFEAITHLQKQPFHGLSPLLSSRGSKMRRFWTSSGCSAKCRAKAAQQGHTLAAMASWWLAKRDTVR